jgi:serine phosphatase RsbU (regulator of sigma subunit)/PAS domain-containing protein
MDVRGPADGAQVPGTVVGLEPRFAALRQAATLPGADLKPILDAALAELDAAITALREQGEPPATGDNDRAPAASAERRLLGMVFRQVPVPLFLLASDGTVRRANAAAGDLLGAAPGYATGKLFTAFVDARHRAAVQSQFAAVARTGKGRQLRCEVIAADGMLTCQLALRRIRPQGEAAQLLLAVVGNHADRAGRATTRRGSASGDEIAAMTRRMDLANAATRIMLENATLGESATLERCARLLAAELHAWVIVDMQRRQRLHRQFVIGPQEQRKVDLARMAAAVEPSPDSVPALVQRSGSAQVIEHPEDEKLLGVGSDGVPLLVLLGGGPVLCVPLSDGERTCGTFTLVRRAGEHGFGMPEAAVVSQIGEHLGRAISVDRAFRRHSEVADALQASLLPHGQPEIPGLQIAASHIAGTRTAEVGGDFYDVYQAADGWGIAIGDVCGKGRDSAAVASAARHAIRVIAHWDTDPGRVLAKANEIMLAEQLGGRFVTAEVAHLRWEHGVLQVRLANAGHPAPVLITADGKAQPLQGGGLPLGIFPDASPVGFQVTLSPNDKLFFFTDGLLGARGENTDCFEDRLAGELLGRARKSPRELLDGMRSAVLDFSDGDLRDDLTMVAVQAVGEPPAR